MGYTGNTKAFIVAQDSEPTSPFDGQIWKDTSTNTTKQYDSASDSWESIQSSGDGQSIGKNGSGEFEVLTDGRTVNIGGSGLEVVQTHYVWDFGSGIPSAWNINIDAYHSDVQAGGYGDKGYCVLEAYSYDQAELYGTFDLTNVDKIGYWLYNNPESTQYGMIDYEVRVSGTTIYTGGLSSSEPGGWYYFEHDVSSYSGSHQIKFWHQYTNDNGPATVGIDGIRLIDGGQRENLVLNGGGP